MCVVEELAPQVLRGPGHPPRLERGPGPEAARGRRGASGGDQELPSDAAGGDCQGRGEQRPRARGERTVAAEREHRGVDREQDECQRCPLLLGERGRGEEGGGDAAEAGVVLLEIEGEEGGGGKRLRCGHRVRELERAERRQEPRRSRQEERAGSTGERVHAQAPRDAVEEEQQGGVGERTRELRHRIREPGSREAAEPGLGERNERRMEGSGCALPRTVEPAGPHLRGRAPVLVRRAGWAPG